jgi:Domain of unknown function (DUF4365)
MRSLKTAKRPRLPRHSAKGISNETLLGQRGVNMVERIVLEMGFVWNPIHIESGIDGIIEIRDASTGETRNKIIQVQVKAVSKFAAEQNDGFSFSCERAHIGYWLGGTARVILIVCRPDTDEVYWKDLKTYFSLPENGNRCTVRFSKTTDRFSVSCSSALLAVAQPEGGLALGPLPKREILGINLLPLVGYPAEIIVTPTKAKSWDEFVSVLKEAKKPWLQEFVWDGGTLYSFFDPASSGLGDLSEGNAEAIPTRSWSESSDLVTQRHFAQLLGKAFQHLCYKRGVFLDRQTGVFYFAKPDNVDELKISSKSVVNVTTKTVVSKHLSIRSDGTPSVYYKHYAFDGRMRRFSNEWFFELTPTYHFTEDGRSSHPNAEILLAGIKRMERHPAVLGAFLTWKEFLTENSLFNFRYEFLTVLSPPALPIDRGIDDNAWRPVAESAEELHTVTEDLLVPPDALGEEDDSLFSWKLN